MAQKLSGKRVAILTAEGFEQVELTDPREALEREGATVEILAPKTGRLRGWNHTDWGDETDVDRAVADASPEEFDALVLPGGVMNPDKLRMHEPAVRFVRAFFESGKPVAAICHGPWTLVEADVVRGFRLTSYPSLRTDLVNAGAHWEDAPVVVDRGLVTSRKPADLPMFDGKLIEEIVEGGHPRREVSLAGTIRRTEVRGLR